MKTTRQPARKAAPQESDERLLVEAAKSDPEKFDALYEMQFERVYAFVSNRVRDRATAEDLTSEVFHKALANLAAYEWRGVPFAAWLLRIAANAVIDQGKRAARELPVADDPPEPTNAEFRVVEDRERLFRLVGQLPEGQRQVVRLRFVEQLSVRDVAGRLGKTEGAIKQLQLRALQRLRTQMGGGHA
jgi:RNA polymerase sigma-70 factor (ECF subfamily)